jgi:hypothetical protein
MTKCDLKIVLHQFPKGICKDDDDNNMMQSLCSKFPTSIPTITFPSFFEVWDMSSHWLGQNGGHDPSK